MQNFSNLMIQHKMLSIPVKINSRIQEAIAINLKFMINNSFSLKEKLLISIETIN